jgi:di/tricarboxylate transporter
MISDQSILFSLLGVVFGLLVWGKIRYDLVAFGALIVAIIIGVVPQEQAFAGFGHHATVTDRAPRHQRRAFAVHAHRRDVGCCRGAIGGDE